METRSNTSPPRISALLLFIATLFLAPSAKAQQGSEVVLILDNTGSMVAGSQLLSAKGSVDQTLPAMDPNRLVAIATQILIELMGKDDRLSILNFDDSAPGRFKTLPARTDSLATMSYVGQTWFSGPLREASRLLSSSQKPRRVLLLFTDGMPSPGDEMDSADALQILGLDPKAPAFEVFPVALHGGNEGLRQMQEHFLAPLGELSTIANPLEMVSEFSRIYARTLRSKPESGRLSAGSSYSFEVPRYVSEVMVFTVSEGRSGAFATRLEHQGKTVQRQGAGDSSCSLPFVYEGNPKLCTPPFHHYELYRQPHNPKRSSQWRLTLPNGAPVVYGIIYRYDLEAEITSAPRSARLGEEVEIRARLKHAGKVFEELEFFQRDHFRATLRVGEEDFELRHQPDHTFSARIRPSSLGEHPLGVSFANTWLDLRAQGRNLQVEGWLPLELVVEPAQVDFGSWTGGNRETQSCVELDLSRSLNADRVPLQLLAQGIEGLSISLMDPGQLAEDLAEQKPGQSAASGSKAEGKLRPGSGAAGHLRAQEMNAIPAVPKNQRLKVCAIAPGCCSNTESGANSALILRGADPHYYADALRIPLTFQVHPTPFLICWWRYIAAAAALALLIVILVGISSPHDFDPDDAIRLASSEHSLNRAIARRLRDLPLGRRGFYRNARVAFDSTGNAISSKKAAVFVLNASSSGIRLETRTAVERKDPRTRSWVLVSGEEAMEDLRRGQVYRVGEMHFRLG